MSCLSAARRGRCTDVTSPYWSARGPQTYVEDAHILAAVRFGAMRFWSARAEKWEELRSCDSSETLFRGAKHDTQDLSAPAFSPRTVSPRRTTDTQSFRLIRSESIDWPAAGTTTATWTPCGTACRGVTDDQRRVTAGMSRFVGVCPNCTVRGVCLTASGPSRSGALDASRTRGCGIRGTIWIPQGTTSSSLLPEPRD